VLDDLGLRRDRVLFDSIFEPAGIPRIGTNAVILELNRADQIRGGDIKKPPGPQFLLGAGKTGVVVLDVLQEIFEVCKVVKIISDLVTPDRVVADNLDWQVWLAP